MADTKMVTVRNRNAGSTGYTLENGFHRNFEYNEVKQIPLDELVQLSYAPGGEDILRDCLVIEDQAALDYLNMQVEPEYFYSENEIRQILLEGTLDQLEDTLNFAPGGALEMIKKLAIELEIPDVRKRDMISNKTGFNINNAINIQHALMDGEDEASAETAPTRKTTPLTVAPSTGRKAPAPAPDKYKVVVKK